MADLTQLTDKQSRCPECDESFASLSRHWGHNPSHRPDIDVLQRAVCAGLVLGGCRIDTQNQTPALDVRTQYLGFAVWIHEQLEWLANTIQYNPPGDRQEAPTFIVRTVAHPELDTFRRWRMDDDRPSAAATVVTMLTIRTWVAKAAGVGWSGESKSRMTRFHAEEAVTRDWYRRILRHLGYEPYDSGRRLELDQSESIDLFESIGPAVPGMEHKWEFEKEGYEERRREQWITQQEVSHAEFTDGTLGPAPAAWDRKYSEREALVALLSAADGESLPQREYTAWRRNQSVPTPSRNWYAENGGWQTWLSLAGLERAQEYGGRNQQYEIDDVLQTIQRMKAEIGHWPDTQEYKSHRRDEDASLGWIYKKGEIESWSDLLARAKAESTADD